MNPAEFLDWLSTQSVGLRAAVLCPLMLIVIAIGLFFIVFITGGDDNG